MAERQMGDIEQSKEGYIMYVGCGGWLVLNREAMINLAINIERQIGPGWISVKDRLPEHGNVIDIWLKNGGRATGVYYFNFVEDGDGPHFFDGHYRRNYRYEVDEVTHWMPLPSKP